MARQRQANRKRYADDHVVRLTEKQRQEAAMRTAVEARQRVHGARTTKIRVGDDQWAEIGVSDPLWGSVVGRLWADGVLSKVQYDAAHIYAERRKSYLKRKTDTDPNPASPGFANVSRGLSCAPEEDPEVLARKDRQHNDMIRFLKDLEAHNGPSWGKSRLLGLIELMDRVCVLDLDIAQSAYNVGALREGLNEVARMCRMER